jgi:glycerol-1-phosphate dehydrogenase [NAD(P)+]
MDLNYHYMQLPREVIVGKGTLKCIPEVVRRLHLSGQALVLTDEQCFGLAGASVAGLLVESGFSVDILYVKSMSSSDVAALEERIKEFEASVLFGVGGGTIIDSAKVCSGSLNVPFISVPTSVSHDGIASPLASVKGGGKPFSVMVASPLAIVADIEVISKAPWRFVVSGCGDVISKFTAVKDWKLAHFEHGEYYGGYAASLALMSARLVTQNAELIAYRQNEGLRVLLEALISCGVAMSIAGSSRPCSGSEHLFSHALDVINHSHAMHGEQCGVGTILSAYLYRGNWKRIKRTLKRLGAPTTASELGVEDSDVVEALDLASRIRPDRFTILQKLKLSLGDCEEAARATGVIG